MELYTCNVIALFLLRGRDFFVDYQFGTHYRCDGLLTWHCKIWVITED